jgi:2'-5' RNA ligase
MLSELHQRLEIECEKRGFPTEERAFKPHLTLARLRGGSNTRALVDAHLKTDFPAQTVQVNELIVFRSELSSHGSKYTALSKHGLV